jgi:two-component system response regulator RegA
MGKRSSKPVLLLVDDDEIFGDVLSIALTKRGFSVELARTTDEAISCISVNIPDYAIIDLRIGEQSGLTLVEHLHQQTNETRTVVLTGYGSIATAVEAIKKGAKQYLTKPTAVDDIIAALRGEKPASEEMLEASRRPSVKRLEWEHIQSVLNENNGNISATARALGMHRRTLQRKLKKYPVRD